MIINGNDDDAIWDLKTFLGSCFKNQRSGSLKYLLGVEIAQTISSISFCLRKYTPDILEDTGLLGAKLGKNPMEAKEWPSQRPYSLLKTNWKVNLSYNNKIRNHICNKYTQSVYAWALEPPPWHNMMTPSLPHRSPWQGLLFSSIGPLHLTAYCDAD